MNNKDFEQWLTREEGILKVEKEVDEWCENDVFVNELYKRYRQLEKDNAELEVCRDIDADTINNYAEASIKFQKAIKILSETKSELLAALKPFALRTHGIDEWKSLEKTYTKHKGESE